MGANGLSSCTFDFGGIICANLCRNTLRWQRFSFTPLQRAFEFLFLVDWGRWHDGSHCNKRNTPLFAAHSTHIHPYYVWCDCSWIGCKCFSDNGMPAKSLNGNYGISVFVSPLAWSRQPFRTQGAHLSNNRAAAFVVLRAHSRFSRVDFDFVAAIQNTSKLRPQFIGGSDDEWNFAES